ncbi:MAG TPA: twin-arginine translocase TatA/TatE family subunit [Chthoniobacteraceae bacterium]|nr:twin-arginine translocase TatA/TatE family subunit [Chthoniobacteraceae bacterium]
MTIALLNNFFGPDTLIIFLVILLLFGAKKLPELARGMGQAVREFSKAKDEIEREVTRPPVSEDPKALNEPRPPVTADTTMPVEHEADPHAAAAQPEHHDPTHVA